MATIYDIAKKAGVSITTVSRVINNHPYVKDSTRKKVKKLLTEASYVPNSNASSLVRKTTNTIAVILPDITNNFFATLFHGAEEKANENGFAVIFGNTNEDIVREEEYIRMFMERRVDGLMLDPISQESHILKPIFKNEIPLVILDREIKGISTSYVGSNNKESASALVEYLIGLGHRRIGLITGLQGISVYRKRTEGYLAALADTGININSDYIKVGKKPIKEVGYLLAQEIVKVSPRTTALFAANNFLAIGAVKGLKELGIKVPEDIAIVCFDDFDNGSVLNPFFTSMNQPAYEIGLIAMELLIKQIKKEINDPERIILESSLCVRHST